MKKNKRKVILFCAASPPQSGVVENYALAHIYGLEYIKLFSLRDPEIKRNYEIEVLSLSAHLPREEIVDIILHGSPDIVGLSCSVKNYFVTLDIARQIKLASPETDIVAGGPEMFAPENIMEKNKFIDYVVMGEGEETFRELLLNRLRGDSPEGVASLCFRKEGKPFRTVLRPPIADLNFLPRIVTKQRAADSSGVVLYETARGCRHSCTYCLWSPYPKRYFSIRRVLSDVKLLLDNKKVSRIFFIDSDFDSDPQRAVTILRYVKENNPNGVKVSAFLSFDHMDDELLSLMGELCHEVPIGLQTVDHKCLKALGRSWFDLARFDASLQAILRHISADNLYIDLMYGLPHETPDVFIDTLLWCVKRGLNHINFFRIALYPGTPLEKSAFQHGYVYDTEPPHMVYSSKYFSYEDLLSIENAITNFKILSHFFNPQDMITLEGALDLREALIDFNKGCEWMESCYTRINESNIADIDVGKAAPWLVAYLEKNISSSRILNSLRKKVEKRSLSEECLRY